MVPVNCDTRHTGEKNHAGRNTMRGSCRCELAVGSSLGFTEHDPIVATIVTWTQPTSTFEI